MRFGGTRKMLLFFSFWDLELYKLKNLELLKQNILWTVQNLHCLPSQKCIPPFLATQGFFSWWCINCSYVLLAIFSNIILFKVDLLHSGYLQLFIIHISYNRVLVCSFYYLHSLAHFSSWKYFPGNFHNNKQKNSNQTDSFGDCYVKFRWCGGNW